MQEEPVIKGFVVVEMVDSVGVERAWAAYYAVDIVAFLQEYFRKIRAVLPSYASY